MSNRATTKRAKSNGRVIAAKPSKASTPAKPQRLHALGMTAAESVQAAAGRKSIPLVPFEILEVTCRIDNLLSEKIIPRLEAVWGIVGHVDLNEDEVDLDGPDVLVIETIIRSSLTELKKITKDVAVIHEAANAARGEV